jgi:hypothetical protein
MLFDKWNISVVYVLLIVVCPFVLFLLAIVLSVLLRDTDSDYPFGIFKLFLYQARKFNCHVYVLGVSFVIFVYTVYQS